MKHYYSENGITIYHADCREVLLSLDVSDLLLTDPPYGIGLDMILSHGTSEKSIHESSNWNDFAPSKECFDLMYEKSKTQIIWGCNYFLGSIRDVGRIVHDKELLIEGTKLKWSEADLASCSSQRRITIFRYRWNGNVQGPTINWNNTGPDARVHPTQKPLALMRHCINTYSKESHVILDPFMGSGTTLRAAKDLGRNAIGIEIEEKYCEIAANRLRQIEARADGVKQFDRGYVCAVANIINTHDEGVVAWDVLRANMPDDWNIIDEADRATLKPMLDYRSEIERLK